MVYRRLDTMNKKGINDSIMFIIHREYGGEE